MTAPTLPGHLDDLSDLALKAWLRTQPAAVHAVVDLALVEDNATIVAAFAPAYVETFAEIAEACEALDDEQTMSDREWLEKWLGSPGVGFFDAAGLVERRCEDFRATVRTGAQLVASLMVAGRAA